ncbi:Uncharacterised protein [Chromobacterium violaceum]|uniref:Uncharacterized protein n=1 Tax=Chromobacterium violaceum TaxID=536 RepID=A0A447TEZ2_CHRVL|nr:Uncharacterised protein [Chromobacterium violaceum]
METVQRAARAFPCFSLAKLYWNSSSLRLPTRNGGSRTRSTLVSRPFSNTGIRMPA